MSGAAHPRPTHGRLGPMDHITLPRRSLIRIATLLLALVALGVGAAQAPTLPRLLPEETVFALGLRDLASHEAKLQPFVEEAERLELGRLFTGFAPEEAEEEWEALPPAVAELSALDLLGDEIWMSVSVSRFNPLPAVTIVARPSERGAAAVDETIAEAGDLPTMEEGGVPFYLWQPVESEGELDLDMEVPPFAIARVDGLVILSSQPEVMRGVLRRHAGDGEPSLLDSEAWNAAMAPLADGHNGYSLLHLAPVLPAVRPLVQGMVPESLIERVAALVETIGPSASVLRLTDEGLASASRQVPNPEGGDTRLFELLTDPGAADTRPLAFAPEGALTIGVGTLDLRGWWAWLGDVVASAPELELPTLDEMTQMFGVDVEQALLSWSDDQFATIVTGVAAPTEPGVAADALLGEQVLLVEAQDEEAAFRGLSQLLQTVGMQLSALADPSGQPQAMLETVEIAGVEVAQIEVMENVVLSAATVDGYALLSGSNDSMRAVLEARAAGTAPPAPFAELAAGIPESSRSYTLTDDRAAIQGTVDALIAQLQLGAGLAGAQQLDFEGLDAASEAVRAYASFVAERLSGSRAVTVVEDGAIVGESLTPVDW